MLLSIIRLTSGQTCYDTGNFTTNSTYGKNRDLFLSSLASNVTANKGFYTSTIGQIPDAVYGLALCRGDSTPESCASCLNFTVRDMMKNCPNQKEAISWGGMDFPCVVRYSNRSFFGKLELKPTEFNHNINNITSSLTQLLGFSFEGTERLLIYEFVPNSSVDKFIFDAINRVQLDWETRYKIIGGIARGILYLHEDSRLRIIHRDLKASNILLDADMIPKISDFGMARLFEMDQSQGDTSRIVGTFGYMAPEYVTRGHFSIKSDVFSFGVLVLEIISGQKNNSFRIGEEAEDLLTYAWKNWNEGTALNLIDPTLRNGSSSEIMRCIHIGLLCVQENVANRPTMASVVVMLNSSSLSLPLPSQPAFFMHTTMETDNLEFTASDQSKSGSIHFTVNEVTVSELDPR
ncbi:hypothetical protein CUMW_010320 [Citrus unshiu]|nr:hypothetical protein CUMW_010320 [Citrus unshiu]